LIRPRATGFQVDEIAELRAPDIFPAAFIENGMNHAACCTGLNSFFHKTSLSLFSQPEKTSGFSKTQASSSRGLRLANPADHDSSECYFDAFFFAAGFFATAFFAAGFFATGFFAAAFVFFTAAFFLGAAAIFFGGLGPLFTIGSSQQINSVMTQPQSSSTRTASPHTSQLRTSPGFTFDICVPSSF
jgi:hypothetical protein